MLCLFAVWVVGAVVLGNVASAREAVQVDVGGQQIKSHINRYADSEERIFVSIAAFMDPELLPTITNMLENAKFPDKLDFGILIQEDTRSEFPWEGQPNFNVRRVHYLESQGVGWARYTGRQLYGNQTYLLQLDSHHRFVKDWDAKLIEDFWKCIDKGSSKPILSTYLPSYNVGSNTWEHYTVPHKVVSERYYDSGKVRFVSYLASEAKGASSPHLSAVISAHFIFTWGFWLAEVPYDPQIYFDGEEDTLSARSWTHGYDIYYPHRNLIFHLYGRLGQKKHWDIHPDWWKIKRRSEARVRQVLGQEPSTTQFGEFGMGPIRSFNDFQVFSGLYFPFWHLGSRALTGDVTIVETNPPPDKSPGEGRCMYSFPGGEVVDIGNNKWEERKGDTVSTFDKVAAKETPAEYTFLLYDAAREMFLRLEDQKISWGQGKRKGGGKGKRTKNAASDVAHWVTYAEVSAVGCL